MSKKRYVDTKFWDDNYIIEKDPNEKLLFLLSVERKAEIKQMDKWFYGLPTNSQADMACRFWENATYEQKAEEYYIS